MTTRYQTIETGQESTRRLTAPGSTKQQLAELGAAGRRVVRLPNTHIINGKEPFDTGKQDMNKQLTAIIRQDGDSFVSLCPELDIASQGDSIEEAKNNLREALELFFECASESEISQRLSGQVVVTQVEVAVG